MTKEELFSMLQIETPADLEYFEQFADLMEYSGDIPYDLFCTALSQISAMDAGEIAENYFEELSSALPDGSDDIEELLSNIQDRLMLLAEDIEESSNSRRSFCEELYKFREWYDEPFGASVDGDPCTMLEAVTLARIEKLGQGKHKYNFSDRLNYELDEMSVGLGSFSKIDLASSDEYDEP